MHADSGRRYRAYPSPGQAGRLTGWGHSCRAVWNLAWDQRRFAWHQRGHTVRSDLPWLADLPAQSAQQVLRQLDRAYDNWWNPEHPAQAPTFGKRTGGLSVPLAGQTVQVRTCSRRWAEVGLPKLGRLRFRLSRPLGGRVRNATISKDALGWHVSFGVATATEPAPPNGLPGCGVDVGVACSAFVSDERGPRLMPSTLTAGPRRRLLGLERARTARSPGLGSTMVAATPTGCAAPSTRSSSSGRGRRAAGRTSPTSSPPTSPRTTAGSPSRTCGSGP